MPRNHVTLAVRKSRALFPGLLLLAVLFPAATSIAQLPSPTRLNGHVFADPDAALNQFSALEEGEMANMRGGLRVAGLDVQFGVNLRTTGNGFMREAIYTLNAMTGGFDQLSNILTTDADISAPVHLVGGSTGVSINDILGPGVDLSGLGDATGGLVISGESGFTAVLERLTQNSIVSALITNTNDQNLTHELNVDINIENFSEYAEAARNASIGRALGRSVRALSAPQ